jgi:small-conductance mechanosensitive channel
MGPLHPVNRLEEVAREWLFDPAVGRWAAALVGLASIVWLVSFLQKTVNRRIASTDMRYRAKKLISFFGYLAAFVFLATIFSDRLGKLTVAFGVAGAGIAFALKEVIASIAGWVAISFGQFYSPGDRVQVGGIRGDVIDVNPLRTTIMEIGQWVDADLYIVRIANSFVFQDPVFNYSADFPFLWDEIKFPLRYGSDWAYAREVLTKVAEEVVGDYTARSKEAWRGVVMKYRIEDAVIDPVVTLRADENWIEYTVRYIVDYRRRRATKDRLYTRILEEVDRSQGRLRIATAGFELLSAPALEVDVGAPGTKKT